MTYATRADLEERFGREEIADLEKGAATRIDMALADAAAEIDTALATLYALPLQSITPDEDTLRRWPALVHIACNLARANLYDDRESEAVTNRKRSVRAKLMRIAKDEAALIDDAGNPARKRETARAESAGPAPVMTPDNLAGL